MLTVPESKLITQTYAQSNNETSEEGMKNMTNATTPLGKIPSMSTPERRPFTYSHQKLKTLMRPN